jgi:DNA repair protein RecO (recombination protein O)
MTSQSFPAWFIHKRWVKETSAIAYFFSESLGIVACHCKGGRTPKKQALLQPFMPLWLTVQERYDRYFIQSIESTAPAFIMNGTNHFAALYVNELIYLTQKPLSVDTKLYEAYSQVVRLLACTHDDKAIEVLLRRFEWTLLLSCGQAFSLTHEANSTNPIEVECTYQLIPEEGFVCRDKGILGVHLGEMARDNLHNPETLLAAKKLMRQAIDHLVSGRPINTRALFSNRSHNGVNLREYGPG